MEGRNPGQLSSLGGWKEGRGYSSTLCSRSSTGYLGFCYLPEKIQFRLGKQRAERKVQLATASWVKNNI